MVKQSMVTWVRSNEDPSQTPVEFSDNLAVETLGKTEAGEYVIGPLETGDRLVRWLRGRGAKCQLWPALQKLSKT